MSTRVGNSSDGLDAFGIGLILLLTAFYTLWGAAHATDRAFAIQMWTGFASLVVGGAMLIHYLGRGPLGDRSSKYENGVIKAGVIASMFWGLAGFLVGVVIAAQLAFPNQLYFEDLGWTNFGRLRPLHTSAVIFAFGGNVLIATSFYVVQRTCRARLAGGLWPWFVFWGYQLTILMAGTGYLLGITQGREYAELPWYVDIWLTLVWVVYLLVFLGTLWKAAREAHLRRELVLSGVHRHDRHAAPHQQHGDPSQLCGLVQLFRLRRRAGCADAMVVRPQRRWLLSHRRLPRHHVLLHSEAGGSPGLFLQTVDHPLLGSDFSLHLGRAAPLALHGAASMGADAWRNIFNHAVDAELGRHDQRPDDAVGRVGQTSHGSRPAHARRIRSILWNGDLRRAGHVDPGGELALALH